MSKIASEEEVQTFLLDLGTLVRSGYLTFVPRRKNRLGMQSLGMDDDSATESIAELTLSEYSKGPEPDDGGEAEDVWVFRSKHNGMVIYIKLIITEDRWVKCLSFHPAEWALSCPYRKQ